MNIANSSSSRRSNFLTQISAFSRTVLGYVKSGLDTTWTSVRPLAVFLGKQGWHSGVTIALIAVPISILINEERKILYLLVARLAEQSESKTGTSSNSLTGMGSSGFMPKSK
eukprot:gb/GECH01011625.1/.p1 GENE.gb/GECH01011625.1/~~gb/GECH01011625.1/.p1  ORF type:complete len:112 (+),score=16.43 gb/GECH01011625.1/:1-336(+)